MLYLSQEINSASFNVTCYNVITKFEDGQNTEEVKIQKWKECKRMEKAKQNEVSKMTLEEAKKLPNDGKPKLDVAGRVMEGTYTSLTLKRGLVKDDGKEYIERRVFRNADMTEVVIYDLPLPLNMKQATEMYGEAECLDAIWTAKRIKTDGEKAGKGTADPEVTAKKSGEKLVASLRKMGQNKAADDIEKVLKEKETIKKGIKAAGFGK
jgi:hypothetical protein